MMVYAKVGYTSPFTMFFLGIHFYVSFFCLFAFSLKYHAELKQFKIS